MIGINNNINQNNYKPSFGTTLNIKNKLPEAVAQNEQVAKVLSEANGKLKKSLAKTGILNHVDLKFRMLRKSFNEYYVRMNTKLSNVTDGIANNKSIKNKTNLFIYNKKTGKITPTHEMEYINTRGFSEHVGDFEFENRPRKTTINSIDLGINHFWKHKDVIPTHNAVKAALETIKDIESGGHLRVEMVNMRDNVKGLKMQLIAATKNERGYNLSDYGTIKLFTVNQRNQLQMSQSPTQIENNIVESFRNLKDRLNLKLN